MDDDRILRASLDHIDRNPGTPLFIRGLDPHEASRLFEGIGRRRPGILAIPLNPGIRSGLAGLFGTGDSSFADGWAAFSVSLGIRGGAAGMEAAAGLQKHRETIRLWLSGEGCAGDALDSLMDALAAHTPAVILAPDTSRLDPFTLDLFRGILAGCHRRLPPLVAASASGAPPFPARVLEAANREEPAPEVPRDLLTLARAAAALGFVFNPVEASELSGNCADPALLVEAGVWANAPRGRLRFRSPRARERILDSMEPEESRTLHARAGALVLRRAQDSPEDLRLAGDLFLRGGDHDTAGRTYLAAARNSGRVTHTMAARLWALAESHCPEAFPRSSLSRSRRLLLGGYLEQALEAAARAASKDEIPASFLMLAILIHMGDDPRAAAMAEHLEGKRRSGLLSPEQETDLEMLSLTLHRRNITPEDFQGEVKRMARRGLTPIQECRLALVEARILARHGFMDRALEAAGRARGMAGASGFDWMEESCDVFTVSCLRKAGRIREAEQGCIALARDAARSGNLEALAYALNTRGGIASSMCDYPEAARCYTAVGRLAEITGNRRLANTAAANLGVAVMMRGGYQEALEIFMKAARMVSEAGDPLRLAAIYGNMARIFLDLDRVDNAEDCVTTMTELAERTGSAHLQESAVFLRARILDLRGRLDEALKTLDTACGMAGRRGSRQSLSLYVLCRGLFLMYGGRTGEALDRLEEASQLCAEAGQSPNAALADVCSAACRALTGSGSPGAIQEAAKDSPWRSVRGTAGYWHWKLTGDPASADGTLELLKSASGENNAYRAARMIEEINGAAGRGPSMSGLPRS
jgi:tetratricopeptide (TPR) repeat protein